MEPLAPQQRISMPVAPVDESVRTAPVLTMKKEAWTLLR
jgi:hypothetical protein